jgi:hypothetical protein
VTIAKRDVTVGYYKTIKAAVEGRDKAREDRGMSGYYGLGMTW